MHHFNLHAHLEAVLVPWLAATFGMPFAKLSSSSGQVVLRRFLPPHLNHPPTHPPPRLHPASCPHRLRRPRTVHHQVQAMPVVQGVAMAPRQEDEEDEEDEAKEARTTEPLLDASRSLTSIYRST